MTEPPSPVRLILPPQLGTSRLSRSITQPAAPPDRVTMTSSIFRQELLGLGLGRGRKAGLVEGITLTMTRALGILA
jgi:hypothetical protein